MRDRRRDRLTVRASWFLLLTAFHPESGFLSALTGGEVLLSGPTVLFKEKGDHYDEKTYYRDRLHHGDGVRLRRLRKEHGNRLERR